MKRHKIPKTLLYRTHIHVSYDSFSRNQLSIVGWISTIQIVYAASKLLNIDKHSKKSFEIAFAWHVLHVFNCDSPLFWSIQTVRHAIYHKFFEFNEYILYGTAPQIESFHISLNFPNSITWMVNFGFNNISDSIWYDKLKLFRWQVSELWSYSDFRYFDSISFDDKNRIDSLYHHILANVFE